MRTIYIDADYVCHLENDGTMIEVQTDTFDNISDEEIKGYRYIPYGYTWVRDDGITFHGLMVSPCRDIRETMLEVAMSYLTDEEAETVTMIFPNWESGVAYFVGDRRQYDGLLYRCVQAHTSQSDWTPDKTPALWVRTWTDPFPEWVQPTGAHDAYKKGDKVSHLEKHWVSDIDANVYEPSVYGWSEV